MSYQKELTNIYPNHSMIASIVKDLQKKHNHALSYTKKTYSPLYKSNHNLFTQSHEINAKTNEEKYLFLSQIFTEKKIQIETMTYELLHYKGKIDDDVFETINKFNILIQDYVEDQFFRKHTESTYFFNVKDGHEIYSNTILSRNKYNAHVITHLQMLVAYLNRNFDSKFNYYIKEDDKHDFCWIFIKNTNTDTK
jgi:hypothetical protein